MRRLLKNRDINTGGPVPPVVVLGPSGGSSVARSWLTGSSRHRRYSLVDLYNAVLIMLAHALFLVFPAIVVLAGIGDMMTMSISNRFSLVLIAAFVVMAPFVLGLDWQAWGGHLAAGGIMLVVSFVMFAFGWIGGGDAKLSAVIALWLGLPNLAPFIVYATLFGGALTLFLLGFRNIPIPILALRVPWIVRLHALRDGIPYGMALSAGALTVYPQTIWLQLLN